MIAIKPTLLDLIRQRLLLIASSLIVLVFAITVAEAVALERAAIIALVDHLFQHVDLIYESRHLELQSCTHLLRLETAQVQVEEVEHRQRVVEVLVDTLTNLYHDLL